ncbi:DUF2591 family protein [Pseudomonas sp. CCI3.2]|uniref:phage protein NinX family protein n=1 Tax=unclassified Pseudomonas TaxID=196821 RepID=UPI002B237A97|nr:MULTISPECIES: phage protein NinX family protein [unclassified Pseudomonas]MEB0078034.1 DUF2591 family protein [Pseudomonas sp. MH10out]MEB0104041.1 DUF2591 family protein [Pseudomonas sp. CCI3.2]MEB0133542.1 DUF2591 family protein [Pseudomonas sp. CCI2.4]
MSEFVEIKTADLVGTALDWATFCAVYPDMQPIIKITESTTKLLFKNAAKPVTFPRSVRLARMGLYGIEIDWYPSSDWECGGPLIEADELTIEPSAWDWKGACALWRAQEEGANVYFEHTNLLVAAMRAVVHAKLGDTVSVPKELV